jgi:ribosomal protein S18 acetylase RimI-like enzyme
MQAGCRRVWLITTNDNLEALGFYQKRGFVLAALHRNAMAETRRFKPNIPLIGMGGIPLRDELELERKIAPKE